MSEFINNSSQRKELLRHMLVRLHEGESPDLLRNRLTAKIGRASCRERV